MDSVTKPKHASPATTLWGKNLDLEDGYMVSALSMLPESLETLAEAPQPAAPTRRRRSSNQGSTVDTAAAVTPATRTRDRTRGRNARNRTRGAPASKEKSDERSSVTEHHDTLQVPSQPKDTMPVDPQLIISQTQHVPTPVPKPESVAPLATVNNPRPRKVRRKQAKAPSEAVVNTNATPNPPGAIKHPDNLGRSQVNGTVLDGEQGWSDVTQLSLTSK
jgi:hypothetical protein